MSTSWYLVPLLFGIFLGVFAMLGGIEAREAVLDRFGREPGLGRIRANVPVIANALAVFGLVGHLASRWMASPAGVLGIALGAAVVAAFAVSLTVRRWAVPSALAHPEDPRFVLQGQVATVTRAIGPSGAGEISYELHGRRFVAAAVSIDGSPISASADVVIERVDGEVVVVESWTAVEQRI